MLRSVGLPALSGSRPASPPRVSSGSRTGNGRATTRKTSSRALAAQIARVRASGRAARRRRTPRRRRVRPRLRSTSSRSDAPPRTATSPFACACSISGPVGREPDEPFTVAVGAVEVERLAVADQAVTQPDGHDHVEELVDPVARRARSRSGRPRIPPRRRAACRLGATRSRAPGDATRSRASP